MPCLPSYRTRSVVLVNHILRCLVNVTHTQSKGKNEAKNLVELEVNLLFVNKVADRDTEASLFSMAFGESADLSATKQRQ